MPLAPTLTLNNGVTIPALGLGTWPMNNLETADAVATAAIAGYRLFDTAENYENEAGVGEGIRRSGLPRDEVFVTSKLNKKWHSYDGVQRAFEASSKRLGLDVIDLYLIHWPNPDQNTYVDAFRGLRALQDSGRVRAIGVSNFLPEHLQQLFDEGLVPQVNQIKLDPTQNRSDLRAKHAEHGIITEAWSPLGQGNGMIDAPEIVAIAAAHGRTPGQVVLRWHTQNGIIPTPKSANAVRQAENISIFDFELSAAELDALSALDVGTPLDLDPLSFGH
ncbi:aldo/keto reductase [Cryobacterium melibiosiphilum]|uniref:Aldo/keto reductase n=1 Tax=Cryobacterium melibiosiphilum TaxID=995039 RepID=A0A3A5MB77_9MICO|nr:aldo/keto reductase [Cryobacterium melibiosiphilum]RJT85599.1 aldo/keto reductase [Cryobacterium melibiosiphilum]